MFGFYSLGVTNYENVCIAIKDAKSKGVKFRLIINVSDAFSAAAAKGLITIVQDEKQIKSIKLDKSARGTNVW